METLIVKIIVCLTIISVAVFGVKSCDTEKYLDVYDAADGGSYLDLVSDYSEVVPESEWGR